MATEDKRKSVISRSIKRTWRTAQYESLVLDVAIEEEIEWTTLTERQKKIDNWTTVLLQDFKQSSARIINELGITNVVAYFDKPNSSTIDKFGDKKVAGFEAPALNKNLDLDDLDTIG